jgi:hypothetical protein
LPYHSQKQLVARLSSSRPTGAIAQKKDHENSSLSATGCYPKLRILQKLIGNRAPA